MEEIQEMEREEKETRWTTRILLIGNLIVWTIVLIIISVFYSLNVFAATLNPDTNQIQVKNIISGTETYVTIGQNQNYTVQVTETVPLFVSNWINLPTGVIDGKWSITFPVASGTTCNDLKQQSRFIVSVNDLQYNATKSFTACTISNNVASLQMKYNTTNTIANATFKTIYYVPGQAIGGTYKSYQQTDFVAKDYASNIDIENGVINIINNAIQNATNVMTNQNEDTNALIQAIKEQNQTCEILVDKEIKGRTIGLLNGNGTINTSQITYSVTDYIRVNSNETYTFKRTNTNNQRYCTYDMNKTLIECTLYGNGTSINITSTQDGYIRITLNISSTNTISGKQCMSNTEALIESNESMMLHMSDLSKVVWQHKYPDTQEFDIYEDKEQDLFEIINEADTESVSIDIDTESNTWIWNTMTTLIQSNGYLLGMIISILSIGVLKLVLNR